MTLSAITVALWAFEHGEPVYAQSIIDKFKVTRRRANEIMRQLKRSTRYQVEHRTMPEDSKDRTAIVVLSVNMKEQVLEKNVKQPKPVYTDSMALVLGIKQRNTD